MSYRPRRTQVASPVSKIGPVTTRGRVTLGFLTFNMPCTDSNSSRSK
ncbi:hypothetical protein M2281_005613 [Mesorhizobium soli]|nr:hypothetical protein [Mesorhizobium soli]